MPYMLATNQSEDDDNDDGFPRECTRTACVLFVLGLYVLNVCPKLCHQLHALV